MSCVHNIEELFRQRSCIHDHCLYTMLLYLQCDFCIDKNRREDFVGLITA